MTGRPITPVAALTAVLLAAVLALAGCDYLLDSPFPSYVPLMTDEANVADEMPYEEGAHYELRVAGSPSGDYVWIYGEGSSFRERFALALLLVRRGSAGLLLPDAALRFAAGDRLVVFGPSDRVAALRSGAAGAPEVPAEPAHS